MYKIIKFDDGTETVAYEPDNVQVEIAKDNTLAVGYIYSNEKPRKEKGKFVVKGEKRVVDLTKGKPHNKAKDPLEATNQESL